MSARLAGGRNRGHGELPCHTRLASVAHCGHRVRPVAHEYRGAVLECEARFLLVPCKDVERSDVPGVQLVAHELQRANGFRVIDHDSPTVVENSSAEGSEIFDESGDEPFIARALPNDSKSRAART